MRRASAGGMTRAQQPWISGPDRAVRTRLRSNRAGGSRPGQRDVWGLCVLERRCGAL